MFGLGGFFTVGLCDGAVSLLCADSVFLSGRDAGGNAGWDYSLV